MSDGDKFGVRVDLARRPKTQLKQLPHSVAAGLASEFEMAALSQTTVITMDSGGTAGTVDPDVVVKPRRPVIEQAFGEHARC